MHLHYSCFLSNLNIVLAGIAEALNQFLKLGLRTQKPGCWDEIIGDM